MSNKKYDLSKTADLVKKLQKKRDAQRKMAELCRKKGFSGDVDDEAADKCQSVIDEIRYITWGEPGYEKYI